MSGSNIPVVSDVAKFAENTVSSVGDVLEDTAESVGDVF